MQPLKDQRVTVQGLGRFNGGVTVARWLVEQGARVLVTDKDTPQRLEPSVRKLAGLPVEFHLGEHRKEDFTSADLVIASPAALPGSEYLAAARAAGVPITTEMRLFVERCPATVLGVTGTKGKSTATAMLGEMLRQKFTVWVGGNIGRSLLPDLAQIDSTHLVVLELSSYMLHYLGESKWSPHVALVTMIAADHLAWHGSMDAYVDAKRNIFRNQRTNDYLVLNESDAMTASMAREARGHVMFYGARQSKHFELLMPGAHNQQNAQGAFAAAQVMGIDWDQAQNALADFKALPHRLELIYDLDGVRYYNDSIATIPDAAIAALDSFPNKKVIQIIGGSDKGLPVTSLCAALIERAKAVLCIGETGAKMLELLEQSTSQSAAGVYNCGDLATAVRVARQIATAGDVVLLSPGFASYDQYVNFEARGEQFAKLVRGSE